jgi:hypothetical protein
VPGAPRSPTPRSGNRAATLHWTAPASAGGAGVLGYVVTPCLGNSAQNAQTFMSNATAATIAPLLNAKTYTFTLAATDAVGIGPPSNPTAPITVGTPGAPRSVTATAWPGRALLRWAPPSVTNGIAITGYTVIPFSGATPQRARTFKATVTTAAITGFAALYTFKVAAQ